MRKPTNQPTNQPTNRTTEQQTNQQTNRQGKNNMSPTTICFQSIFKLVQDIIATNLLCYSHIQINSPPPGWHVSQATGTILELVQDRIGAILLNKLHDNWTLNVASRVLTRKNAQPPGGHVYFKEPEPFSNSSR
ncbi:hypothetical protein DPMN_102592 [Dreissena polymorpha]|uniref:Uncharacterized protein n=1 Tax=Dreissena polymorpha TaxID=45954 RepID=A0A9D4R977_DREPO|nr:hypothetical protein DPMN_102592 [Dreissena polymorpha]